MTRATGWLLLVVVSMAVLTVPVATAGAQEGERKVSIDQVPPAVKAAILKAVGHGKLVDIGEIKRGGKKVYEIEMVVDGKEWDVLFAADGTELERSFEGLKSTEGKGEEENEKEENKEHETAREFQDAFDIENRELASTGRNRYFILLPGYRLVLEGKEGKHTVQLAVTVLDETKMIGNIETRVVEERESVDGALVEISRNFFAICKQTKSVFYFGEEVDIYKDGKVVGHEGAWIHGQNGARAGLMMPGDPVLGARYYQEVAPKVAMDRGEVVSLSTVLQTPAGKFEGCLKIREENPLDREKEFKIHAPGVGLVQDEDLLLVKHGFVSK
jgi:hypothetical protein